MGNEVDPLSTAAFARDKFEQTVGEQWARYEVNRDAKLHSMRAKFEVAGGEPTAALTNPDMKFGPGPNNGIA